MLGRRAMLAAHTRRMLRRSPTEVSRAAILLHFLRPFGKFWDV
jgi:hypothetical protein